MSDRPAIKTTQYLWVQDKQMLFDAMVVARRNAEFNQHEMSRTIRSSVAWIRSSQGLTAQLPSSLNVLLREAEACNCTLLLRVYSLRKLRLRQEQQNPQPGVPVYVDEYNETLVPFGKQIQRARERAELTLDQLGELIGMSGNNLHKWESKKSKTGPSVESLMTALTALECGLAFTLIDNTTGEPVQPKTAGESGDTQSVRAISA